MARKSTRFAIHRRRHFLGESMNSLFATQARTWSRLFPKFAVTEGQGKCSRRQSAGHRWTILLPPSPQGCPQVWSRKPRGTQAWKAIRYPQSAIIRLQTHRPPDIQSSLRFCNSDSIRKASRELPQKHDEPHTRKMHTSRHRRCLMFQHRTSPLAVAARWHLTEAQCGQKRNCCATIGPRSSCAPLETSSRRLRLVSSANKRRQRKAHRAWPMSCTRTLSIGVWLRARSRRVERFARTSRFHLVAGDDIHPSLMHNTLRRTVRPPSIRAHILQIW
mmetsp:Transcript_4954/g.13835  ORF Transcript_4954/g.13835 Transcript_4954/m.13835 type:complete len:275 (-) Transcript_4954:1442-2266(-)